MSKYICIYLNKFKVSLSYTPNQTYLDNHTFLIKSNIIHKIDGTKMFNGYK